MSTAIQQDAQGNTSDGTCSPVADVIKRASEMVARADALLIAAGAGMGVDSGMPDYRSGGGFWKDYPGLPTQHQDNVWLASEPTFHSHTSVAWGLASHMLHVFTAASPHPGYDVLMQMARRMPRGYRVFTSNVDGHFHRAGFPPQFVREHHGTKLRAQCSWPCSRETWRLNPDDLRVDSVSGQLISEAPTCPRCGALARPNAMLFFDANWIGDDWGPSVAEIESWLEQGTRTVVIEVGAGPTIPTVRDFAERAVWKFGSSLIRINLHDSATDTARSIGINLGAKPALQLIWSELSESGKAMPGAKAR